MKKVSKNILKSIALSIILTALCIVLSAGLMTYLAIGFELALYLIQFSVAIPAFVSGMRLESVKEVLVYSIVYISLIVTAICVSICEVTFNAYAVTFGILIFLSGVLGYIIKRSLIDIDSKKW